MKLALLSDIHANMRALTACLDHARVQGVDQHAVLGDLVGYGAEPDEVVDCIMDMARMGAIVLQGNHDAISTAAPGTKAHTIDQHAAVWTRANISREQIAFLDQLPLTHQVGDVLLVHASAHAPSSWHYVDDARTAEISLDAAVAQAQPAGSVRRVFGGHVHQQTLYYRGGSGGLMAFKPTPGVPIPMPKHRQWIATVGSVGQPRDRNVRAMYAIYDTEKLSITFHRVAYDHMAAAQAIRRSGQAEFFAARLEQGK